MIKATAKVNSPYILAQSGVPLILPSSGSIGNNGALTLTTALAVTYSGGCYMRFPANAIFAGSAAGLYYVVMSSAAAGTIYNNTYSSGVPAIPASPTPFVTTGPGAYTQTTGADITAHAFLLPAGSQGNNGTLRIEPSFSSNNSAGSKTISVKVGAASAWVRSRTTTTGDQPLIALTNRGRQDRQIYAYSGNSTYSTASSAGAAFAIDFSADQTITSTLQLAVATDYVVCDSFIITVSPS